MNDDQKNLSAEDATPNEAVRVRELPPAAQRALAEAEERRRRLAAETDKTAATELGGRDGPDPVRYGDWEKDGLISDF